MEYNYRLLPTLAQIEWTRRHMIVSVPAEATSAVNDDQAPEELSDRAQRERAARLAIVAAFERWSRGLTLTFKSRIQIFTDKYAIGSIRIDDWVKDLVPSFGTRSLVRWYSARKTGKAARLGVDRGLARKGTGVLDRANGGKVRDFVLALIVHQPHLSGEAIRDQVEDRFGTKLDMRGKAVDLPPIRAFQRLMASLRVTHEVAITKATNPDLYRSKYAPAGTGTYSWVTQTNTLWMIDASPIDVLCTDGRHSMYGCIDIATRRFVITVSKTPRASAVALMLRKAILAWGVPETIKTDNGSDFVAHDTRRLFAALGIEMDVSHAYSPQEKGHIERAIKTFQHTVGPLLPGFIGHSVADRKAIESRKSFAARLGEDEDQTFGVSVSAAELQRYVDQWLDVSYQHHAHAGLKGASPFQKAAESSASIRTVDERALDLLLMPVAGKDGQRVTTKFGVRIDGFHYQTPAILPGTSVFVRMDPMDAGRAYCFAADGAEFLGEGFCAELRGINPSTLQQAARETQTAIINDHLAAAKAEIRQLGKTPLIEAALRVAASRVPNVIALPKKREAHTTPEIEAAMAAMDAQPATGAGAGAEDLALFHARRPEPDSAPSLGGNVTPLRTQETPHQRFARALEVKRRMESGEPVDPTETHWLGSYQQQSEYRSLMEFYEQSGGLMSL